MGGDCARARVARRYITLAPQTTGKDGGREAQKFKRVASEALALTVVSMSPLANRGVPPDGLTFAWGRGRHGVLGTGSADEEADVPIAVPRTVGGALTGRRLSQICCGELHTLALTADAGAVFSWGSGLMGALGHGGRANELVPRRVEGVPFATQLAAGKHHSAALCPDAGGAVFTWGWDGWEGSTCTKSPVRLGHLAEGSGRQIAAGAFHLAVLTRSDGVVSSGGGVVQAGVLRDAGIVQVCAGLRHTAALAADAHVYTWTHGALSPADGQRSPSAQSRMQTTANTPLRCGWLGGSLRLSCGGDYTFAVLPGPDGARVIRWQHIGAPDGATPLTTRDPREAGEVNVPGAEKVIAGGGYAIVMLADGGAVCLAAGGGASAGGGGGAGGFGGLPLGLAPPLATQGERLVLPTGGRARLACVAISDFHAVACVEQGAGGGLGRLEPVPLADVAQAGYAARGGHAALRSPPSAHPSYYEAPLSSRRIEPQPTPSYTGGVHQYQPTPSAYTPHHSCKAHQIDSLNASSHFDPLPPPSRPPWDLELPPSRSNSSNTSKPHSPSQPLNLPQTHRMSDIAYGTQHAPVVPPPAAPPLVPSMHSEEGPPMLHLAAPPPPAASYDGYYNSLPTHSVPADAVADVTDAYVDEIHTAAVASRFAASNRAAGAGSPAGHKPTLTSKSPTEAMWMRELSRLTLGEGFESRHDFPPTMSADPNATSATAITAAATAAATAAWSERGGMRGVEMDGALSPRSLQVSKLEEQLKMLKKMPPSSAQRAEATPAPPPPSSSFAFSSFAPSAAPPPTAPLPPAAPLPPPTAPPQGVGELSVAELAAQVGEALRAELVSEVKRDLAAELRSQVQQMQASLVAILKPSAAGAPSASSAPPQPSPAKIKPTTEPPTTVEPPPPTQPTEAPARVRSVAITSPVGGCSHRAGTTRACAMARSPLAGASHNPRTPAPSAASVAMAERLTDEFLHLEQLANEGSPQAPADGTPGGNAPKLTSPQTAATSGARSTPGSGVAAGATPSQSRRPSGGGPASGGGSLCALLNTGSPIANSYAGNSYASSGFASSMTRPETSAVTSSIASHGVLSGTAVAQPSGGPRRLVTAAPRGSTTNTTRTNACCSQPGRRTSTLRPGGGRATVDRPGPVLSTEAGCTSPHFSGKRERTISDSAGSASHIPAARRSAAAAPPPSAPPPPATPWSWSKAAQPGDAFVGEASNTTHTDSYHEPAWAANPATPSLEEHESPPGSGFGSGPSPSERVRIANAARAAGRRPNPEWDPSPAGEPPGGRKYMERYTRTHRTLPSDVIPRSPKAEKQTGLAAPSCRSGAAGAAQRARFDQGCAKTTSAASGGDAQLSASKAQGAPARRQSKLGPRPRKDTFTCVPNV